MKSARDSLRKALRIYALMLACGLRAQRRNKVDFVVSLVNGILFQGMLALFVVAVMSRFHRLGDWSQEQVFLIVGLRTCGHALYVFLFANVAAIPSFLREGVFDRFFLTPVPVLTQVLIYRVNINAVGDLVTGVTVLSIACAQFSATWTLLHWLVLVAAVGCAALLEGAVQIVIAAIGLRSGGLEGISTSVEATLSTLTPYPLDILAPAVRVLFYTIAPAAFIAYVPAALLLGKGDAYLHAPALGALGLLSGPVVFCGSLLLWRVRLRSYEPIGG